VLAPYTPIAEGLRTFAHTPHCPVPWGTGSFLTALGSFAPRGRPASREKAFAAGIRDDKTQRVRYRAAMIATAASNFWYFSYDSSLAVGGLRSI
jgi:hypothetical protein